MEVGGEVWRGGGKEDDTTLSAWGCAHVLPMRTMACVETVACLPRDVPTGFAWPRADWPVAFVGVPHGSEVKEGTSTSNRVEPPRFELAPSCRLSAHAAADTSCCSAPVVALQPFCSRPRRTQ